MTPSTCRRSRVMRSCRPRSAMPAVIPGVGRSVDTMGHPSACGACGDGVNPGVPTLHRQPGPGPVHVDLHRLHRPAFGAKGAGGGGHNGHRSLPCRRGSGQHQKVVVSHPPFGDGEQQRGTAVRVRRACRALPTGRAARPARPAGQCGGHGEEPCRRSAAGQAVPRLLGRRGIPRRPADLDRYFIGPALPGCPGTGRDTLRQSRFPCQERGQVPSFALPEQVEVAAASSARAGMSSPLASSRARPRSRAAATASPDSRHVSPYAISTPMAYAAPRLPR
ncbi:hypothetical protein STENM36S_01160 [Streptomyces tendae]